MSVQSSEEETPPSASSGVPPGVDPSVTPATPPPERKVLQGVIDEMGSPPPPKKKSKTVSTIVKLLIAVAVVAYFVKSGRIDPGRVAQALQPGWVAQTVAIIFCCLVIITIRWWLLLRLEKIDLPLLDALKLTLVGHFWNGILPGAVTGDLVKMYYIGQKHPGLKAEAYATVMIDRIIGLAALVYLSFASALGNLDFVFAKGHEPLKWTFYGNAAGAAAFTVGIAALVLGVGRRSSFADRLRASSLPFVGSLRRGYRTLIRLGERPVVLLASFALGVLSHGLLVLVGITAGRALGDDTLAPSAYAFLVPVGLFVNSVPIGLPGGMGVGEGAFDQLFVWAGVKNHGANVMLLLRFAQLTWAGVGAIVYVFDRKALSPREE